MNTYGSRAVTSAFKEGDEVILAHGTYEGTPGLFLRLKDDPNWADITESNGRIREHPTAWIAHAVGSESST